jgi:DNA-directed RNA polymerase subunit RPC12/RpoP
MNSVKCHRCLHPVPLATTERLPHEFSVRCDNCGRRGFYLASEIQRAEVDQAKGAEGVLSGLRKAS